MPSPSLSDAIDYLASIGRSPANSVVESALATEKANQARGYKQPGDLEEWPDDLAAALLRRVARNIDMRNLTLGFSTGMDADYGAVRIGGLDAEIRRLEAPFKRVRSFGA